MCGQMSGEVKESHSHSSSSSSDSANSSKKKKPMSDAETPALTPSGRKSRATGLRAMPPNYRPTEHDVICAKGEPYMCMYMSVCVLC